MQEHSTRLGRYETTVAGGETVRAYVPAPLPPIPAVELTGLRWASLAKRPGDSAARCSSTEPCLDLLSEGTDPLPR
jgi:hypothetical protein